MFVVADVAVIVVIIGIVVFVVVVAVVILVAAATKAEPRASLFLLGGRCRGTEEFRATVVAVGVVSVSVSVSADTNVIPAINGGIFGRPHRS